MSVKYSTLRIKYEKKILIHLEFRIKIRSCLMSPWVNPVTKHINFWWK